MPRAAKPFKRKGSPYWWISIPDAQQDGKRVKRSTGTTDYAEALTIQRRHQHEWHQLQMHGVQPSRTIDETILAFITDTAHERRAATRARYGWTGKQIQRRWSGRSVQSLTETDVSQYKLERRMDGVGPATIAKELNLVSSAIKHCNHHYGWDLPNIITGRIPKPPKGRTRWLTVDQARALLAASQKRRKAPWLYDMVVVMLNTGMRPGEVLGLEVGRLDELRRCAYFHPEDSKNGEADLVPFNDEAWAAIKRRMAWRKDRDLASSDWIFCDYSGARIYSVKTAWKATLKDAGITDFTRHDMRHTAASWLVQAGYSLEKIGKLLRQKDPRSTARYAHLRNEDALEMVGALQSFGTNLEQSKENGAEEGAVSA